MPGLDTHIRSDSDDPAVLQLKEAAGARRCVYPGVMGPGELSAEEQRVQLLQLGPLVATRTTGQTAVFRTALHRADHAVRGERRLPTLTKEFCRYDRTIEAGVVSNEVPGVLSGEVQLVQNVADGKAIPQCLLVVNTVNPSGLRWDGKTVRSNQARGAADLTVLIVVERPCYLHGARPVIQVSDWSPPIPGQAVRLTVDNEIHGSSISLCGD